MSRLLRLLIPVAVLTSLSLLLIAYAEPSETAVSPAATRFPKNKQNESPMAINPVNADNVITGANDEINMPDCTPASGGSSSCPFVLGVDLTGVYWTTNGGTTWNQTVLNWCPSDNPADPGCLLIADGDPVVAFGPKPDGSGGFTYASGARAYFASLAGGPAFTGDQELVAVSHSDDGGATWSGPAVATTRDGPRHFNDKVAIWADADPDSPFFGNVYVSWTLFTGTFPFPSFGRQGPVFLPEPIMISVSSDGGQTFGAPTKLSPSHNNGAVGGRQGSVITTGPNGEVYVIWDDAIFRRSAILGAKSTDGGRSFSRPFLVAFKNDNPPAFPGASFRTNSFPQVDSDSNGVIYVTWADYNRDTNHGVVKVARSANGGATWSTQTAADISGRSPFFPAIAVTPNGSKVFIGFNAIDDEPDGTAPGAGVVFYDAYYALSTNSGASYGAAVKISAVSSDPDAASTNGLGGQFIGDYNGADATNTTAWFSWTDTRNGATCAAVDAWRASGFTTTKPNIYDSCPAAFGNSDIFVAKITLP